MKIGEKYPLVLFIADASAPSDDITLPLTQGYGGLIWATDEWQSVHPCYVLVPQFPTVAVDDAHHHTKEVDDLARLVQELAKRGTADCNRLYTTGQSMGGMILMYYNVTYPELFAASIFVDSHWDTTTFPELAKYTFVWFIAGDSGKAFQEIAPIEAAAKAAGVQFTFLNGAHPSNYSRQTLPYNK